MLCDKCGNEFSKIVDSRPTDGGIRRRRICNICGHKWTTLEVVYEPKRGARPTKLQKDIDDISQLVAQLQEKIALFLGNYKGDIT